MSTGYADGVSDTSTPDALLAGVIAAEADPPGIDKERWTKLLASHDALHPTGTDTAHITLDGHTVGRMSWSKTANEIDVWGEIDAVADTAWNVAAELDCRFVTMTELLSC